jgi:hypothetical protein
MAFSIQACGDYDKVLQGLWEHYPNLLPNDKSLGNVDKLHDWVMFYDRLAGRVGESQEWELMGFMSYAVVPWYTHMASPANNTKHVEWPKSDYEVCSFFTLIGVDGADDRHMWLELPTRRSALSSRGSYRLCCDPSSTPRLP